MSWLANWYLPMTIASTFVLAGLAVETTDPLRHFVHPTSNDLDAAFWDFERRGGSCGAETVLIVGSSVAREGLDPDALTRRLGRPTFSLALSNAQIVDVERELLLCPGAGTVVLAVNGLNFDDRMRRDPTLPWNRAAGPDLVVRRGELAALIEHRLRSIARAVTSRARDAIAEGRARRLYRYTSRLSATQLDLLRGEMRREYPDDGGEHAATNLAALDRISSRLRGSHATLLVVWLPELPEAAWPPFQRTRERLHARLSRQGVQLLDLTSMTLPESEYHDFHHLLAPGREKVTGEVARALLRSSP